MTFHFIATNRLDFHNFEDVHKFLHAYPDFQTIVLNSEAELEILFKLMGMDNVNSREIHKTHFSKYFDEILKGKDMKKKDFVKSYLEFVNNKVE